MPPSRWTRIYVLWNVYGLMKSELLIFDLRMTVFLIRCFCHLFVLIILFVPHPWLGGLKVFLSLSGIDTTIFSAHSLRGAATSTALIQGVSVSEILSMADWSQESTFRKFYYKPRFNSAPGNAVLSSSSI